MAHIRNLVFSGGGPSGIGHVGALAELEQQSGFSMENVQGVAGTSIGSLFAMLVSLGYTSQEILTKLEQIDFRSFKDSDIGSAKRLYEQYGWYKGEVLSNFIKSFLKEKTGNENITFAELKALGCKDLHVVATRVYKRDGWCTGEDITFSAENTPNESVAAAVLASASVPGLFPAVKLKDDYLYVDGGLHNNYPIREFDLHSTEGKTYNKSTLGFYLTEPAMISDARDGHATMQPIDFSHPGEYTAAMTYGGVFAKQDMKTRKKHIRDRTVFIDRVISLWDFDVTADVRETLLMQGAAAVKAYFSQRELDDYIILEADDLVVPSAVVPPKIAASFSVSAKDGGLAPEQPLHFEFRLSPPKDAEGMTQQPVKKDVACATEEKEPVVSAVLSRPVRQSPSLVDALSGDESPRVSRHGLWRRRVVPLVSASNIPEPTAPTHEGLRKQL